MVWNIPAETEVPEVEGGNFLSFFWNGWSPAWENSSLHVSEGSYGKEVNELNPFCSYLCTLWIYTYIYMALPMWFNVRHNFGDSIFENHNCWLNCGTRGNVWESPGSTGFILWAPWIFITNPVAVHPGDRFETWHKRTRISQVWKCIIFPPFKSHFYAWEHKQNMAVEPCGEQRGKQVQPQCSLDVSQGAVSHCFSRWSRQMSAPSKINDK